jgi:diaminopimelate decarboxylase
LSGLGITYKGSFRLIRRSMAGQSEGARGHRTHCDSGAGRVIVGNSGIFVTKILYVKTPDKLFYIVDGAMNDLVRSSV